MVDLAVPRDVEPEVSSLDDVYLYAVDDLQQVIDENLQSRMQAAEQARDIIDKEITHFIRWQKSLDSVDVISELRQQTQALSDEVLNKAMKQLATGQDAEETLKYLAHTLTNKFLHKPCTQLRRASEQEKYDVIQSARHLLLDGSTKKGNDS